MLNFKQFVMKQRIFYKNILNHCYQRSADNGVLFYNVCDYLHFFTVFNMAATRHPVRVLKLVEMPDHLHQSSYARSSRDLSLFVQDYSSVFAKEHNEVTGASGPVFKHPFGSVPKVGDKKARTNLLYLDNNPAERKLVVRAEDYQWNFLAYGNSSHPFSEKIVLREASMSLRRCLKRVEIQHKSGRHMTYPMLWSMFDSLVSEKERCQLADFIVTTYSVIDHESAIRFFGSYENELLSAHANTGSEYDLNEIFIGKSDACYEEMAALVMQTGLFRDIHEVLFLPDDKKWKLFQWLCRKTSAPARQVAAFLHLPLSLEI